MRIAERQALELWLRNHKVRHADKLATAAMHAVAAQQVRVPGETMAAELIARLATNVIELDKQLTEVDKLIADRFHSHRHSVAEPCDREHIPSHPLPETLMGRPAIQHPSVRWHAGRKAKRQPPN